MSRLTTLLTVAALGAFAAPAWALHLPAVPPATPLACGAVNLALPFHSVESHPPANPCPGIRPGGALIQRFGPLQAVYCSMAFLVTDGAALYVATAGHCVEPSLGVPGVGQRVSALGVPDTFGTVAYQWCEGRALNGGCDVGADFGLIHIDDDKRSYANAAMCHWGAPSGGLFTAHDGQVRKVRHFGWGLGLGDPGGVAGVPVGNPATQARTGLGFDFSEPEYAQAQSAAISGDSGSGVLVSSLDINLLYADPAPRALGVLTHITASGAIVIQRLDEGLARAGSEMGRTFSLVSA